MIFNHYGGYGVAQDEVYVTGDNQFNTEYYLEDNGRVFDPLPFHNFLEFRQRLHSGGSFQEMKRIQLVAPTK